MLYSNYNMDFQGFLKKFKERKREAVDEDESNKRMRVEKERLNQDESGE